MGTAGLVMAAGSGNRFGGLKQFVDLVDGTRLVDRAVATVGSVAAWVGVVLPSGRVWDGSPIDAVGTGGASRQESIAAGLALLPSGFDVVLIHSASHPLASVSLASSAVRAVRAGADAAVPVLPLVDVLKRVEGGRLTTVGREGFGLAQSPMAFSRPVLDAAFATSEVAVEESQLVEILGGRVMAIEGEVSNIHVMDQTSLAMARAIAAASPVV